MKNAIELLKSFPLGIPLKMKVECYKVIHGAWKTDISECLAKPTTFNTQSVRCQIIACEDVYGIKPDKNKDTHAIRFDKIKSYEPLKLEEMPLYIGLECKYPLFNAILEQGDLNAKV